MTEIKSFTDVNKTMRGFMSEARSPGQAYTLERMLQLMKYLGNPQDSYKCIHVAGTSGKTSTAYYTASLLKETGQKVGLTVSPHVDEINERVQINGRVLPEKTYCKEFQIFLNQIDKSNIKPTYFELLVAFAYWEFARQKVDYAIIEVGLGGLLDGTNVITRSDKVCIITDIGYDHIEVLGKTLPEIAAQKAGIIKPYNLVFSYDQGEEVMSVIREVCEQQQAELHEIWPLKAGELPRNLPLFQRRNWYLAYSVYKDLAELRGLKELDEAQLASTTQTHIPARMEIIKYMNKTIVLDGAHNSQKLETLAQSLKKAFPGQSIAGLISFVNTKQARARANMEVLTKLCDHLTFTSFATEEQERVSMDPLKLVQQADSLSYDSWQIEAEPEMAFKQLLDRPEEVLLITGSFFLLNHIRPLILHGKVRT